MGRDHSVGAIQFFEAVAKKRKRRRDRGVRRAWSRWPPTLLLPGAALESVRQAEAVALSSSGNWAGQGG